VLDLKRLLAAELATKGIEVCRGTLWGPIQTHICIVIVYFEVVLYVL
jgi:hypothetical protein